MNTEHMKLDIPRIGYCCKFIPNWPLPANKKAAQQIVESYNHKGSTITHLKKIGSDQTYQKLVGIVKHNINAQAKQFEWLGTQPLPLRMTRISSEFLPGYTHEWCNWVYQQPEVKDFLAQELAKLGELSRKNNIRISMHPGQFTQLNSKNPNVVARSIEDIEYHAMLLLLMGFKDKTFGTEINIHAGSKLVELSGLVQNIKTKLSSHARAMLSIENDEFCWGIRELASIANDVSILLDVHHHSIFSNGEYIKPNDPVLDIVIDSWQKWGCSRPEIHVAMSHETVLKNHDPNKLPDMASLIKQGIKKGHLRKHSDQAWNRAVNSYSFEFLNRFDLCFEGKQKNLSSMAMYEQAKAQGYFTNIS